MSLQTLAARMEYNGGNQLGRINRQKLKSLQAALKSDYNSRPIKTENHGLWRGLINANNLKPDYDKKILSIEFDAGLEAGDVFTCLDDNTHWMVYLPIVTETAYLRSEIIRCRYTLEIEGEEYWIYFQGPTETDLRWYIKSGTNFNELNLSGTIYIKNTPQTKNYFSRFTHIKIDGHIWEVQVTDPISVPGVLELEIQEYYDNKFAELPNVVEANSQSQIVGQQTVRNNAEYGYQIPEKYAHKDWKWSIEGNPRVKIVDTYRDGLTCKVKVEDGAVGAYNVCYGTNYEGYKITVSIDVEEPFIKGPTSIYPYDEIEYTTDIDGVFWIEEEKIAEVASSTSNSCIVKVLTGKKGSFTLYFRDKEDNEYELPIKIKSF